MTMGLKALKKRYLVYFFHKNLLNDRGYFMRALSILLLTQLVFLGSSFGKSVSLDKGFPISLFFWGQTPEQITEIEEIDIKDIEKINSTLWGRIDVNFMSQEYLADIAFVWDQSNEIWRLEYLYIFIDKVDDKTDFRDIRNYFKKLGYHSSGWNNKHEFYALVKGDTWIKLSNILKNDKTRLLFVRDNRTYWPEYKTEIPVKNRYELGGLKVMDEYINFDIDSNYMQATYYWDNTKSPPVLDKNRIRTPARWVYNYNCKWVIKIKNVTPDIYYNDNYLWLERYVYNKYYTPIFYEKEKVNLELAPGEEKTYKLSVNINNYRHYQQIKDGQRILKLFRIK